MGVRRGPPAGRCCLVLISEFLVPCIVHLPYLPAYVPCYSTFSLSACIVQQPYLPPDVASFSITEFLVPCIVQLPYLPAARSECVFLTSGYEAHIKRQRPPPEAKPAELPKLPVRAPWAFAEKARIEEVRALRPPGQHPVRPRFSYRERPWRKCICH